MERLSVLKGTLDMLVLKTLTWGPMHGFEILTWLENHSSQSLDVEDAALYQALRRMEQRGLVSAEMGVTQNNRRARYYHLTPEGRQHLRTESSRWNQYAGVVSSIMSQQAPQEHAG